jgi:hypothetical protein
LASVAFERIQIVIRRYFSFVAMFAAIVGLSNRLETPLDAQSGAAKWSVPRTPWGHPDLQGTYSNDDGILFDGQPDCLYQCKVL